MAERRKAVARGDRESLRADGMENVVTGLGVVGVDKSTGNQFTMRTVLSPSECEMIYRAGGVGRRIIDFPVGEMTREWFTVDGDPGGLCLGYLESLHAKASIQDALRWGDLYGGSLLVLGLDDGIKDLSQPVNIERLNGIASMNVYDRTQVRWTTADLYDNPTNKLWMQPQRYTVTKMDGGSFVVHESRTLKFRGAPIPPRSMREQQGWGDSMLQTPYDSLRNAKAGEAHTSVLLEEWAIGVLTIKNLVTLLAGKDGDAKVRRRLAVIDYGKAILKSMVLAEGESFEKKSQSVSGLADILDRQAQRVAADSGIPVTGLYGEQPSGLQATGESNRKNWYDEVKQRQETKLLPQLERLVKYVFLSKKGPTAGKEPKNWKIEFRPLEQPTELQEAELRHTQAETDKIYAVDIGAVTPEEIAISRFGGERYSTDTTLEQKLRRGEPRDPVEGRRNGNGAGLMQ